MTYIIYPQAWALFLTAMMSLIVAVTAWNRRNTTSGRVLILFMVSIAIWAFFSGIEAGTIDVDRKIFWSKMEYLGFVWASPLCFLFVLSFTNHWKWITKPGIIAIAAISVITLVLAWTNETHGLVWSSFVKGDPSLNILIYNHGSWFYLYTFIQFCLFCLAIGILFRDLKAQKAPYRQQTLTIIIAVLIPGVAGILYSFGISPIPGLDWMPISSLVTGVFFAWSIYYYRLLDLVPIARDILVEQMLDGMIVLDSQQRIIDINPSARSMIKGGDVIKIGDPLASVLPELCPTAEDLKKRSNTQILSLQRSTEVNRFVDVRMTLISGNKPGVNCSLLILRDITKRKNIEDSLNKANQELEKRITEIQILQNQLKEESIRDPLTRLYNRRYMEDALQREFAHATRDGYPVSIIMADIDHFKKVNDTYGHAAGDEVLEQLSRTFMANFRMEDIVCRYGGEEFLIVMPETTAETAFLRIDNLRQQLESSDLNVTGAALRITLSAGIAVYPAEGSTIDEVVQKADQAMYRAKKEGRNRVIAGGFPA
jgi:diguanylate cyclase (GGDEF)-like protein